MSDSTVTIISKVLDLAVGIVIILGIKLRWSDSGSMSMKELIKQIEEKDREIERLNLEIRAWKQHHK